MYKCINMSLTSRESWRHLLKLLSQTWLSRRLYENPHGIREGRRNNAGILRQEHDCRCKVQDTNTYIYIYIYVCMYIYIWYVCVHIYIYICCMNTIYIYYINIMYTYALIYICVCPIEIWRSCPAIWPASKCRTWPDPTAPPVGRGWAYSSMGKPIFWW